MFESLRTIVARLTPLLRLAGAILGGWLLLEGAVFRSGLYYRYVASPDSTAGATERALAAIRARYRPGARNVLVLGDSRTDEGFSAKLANRYGGDINFVGAGVAGSTPRVWYHLLRQIDPDGNRFAAVVLVGIYDTTALNRADMPDRTLDLNYLQPLLRLADVRTLPPSFLDPAARQQAWRSVVFPTQGARGDLRELATAPLMRARQVRHSLLTFTDAYYNYGGNPNNLVGVTLDATTLQPAAPAGVSLPANFYDYLAQLRESRAPAGPLSRENQGYYQYWIERSANRFRKNSRPLFLATLPRGPFHHAFGPAPRPSLASIGLTPQVGVELLAPPEAFDLERPEFYFDGLHLNGAGRHRYTRLLARSLAAAMRASGPAGGAAP